MQDYVYWTIIWFVALNLGGWGIGLAIKKTQDNRRR